KKRFYVHTKLSQQTLLYFVNFLIIAWTPSSSNTSPLKSFNFRDTLLISSSDLSTNSSTLSSPASVDVRVPSEVSENQPKMLGRRTQQAYQGRPSTKSRTDP
ncbi:hypothetical protein JB92DRAFT_3018699, partial [Gautieria morchelliformis]